MPSIWSNAKRPALPAGRLTTKAKFLSLIRRKALLITFHLSLITLLSACTAVGTSKPAALQITSTPEASVFLDGKHIGKTPFSSDQLKSGEHLVKLTAGEASYVGKVDLKEGTLTVINRELASNFLVSSGEVLWLEKNEEGLFIVSMPSGAEVIMDGTLIGQTPLLFAEIAPGDHKVTLTKSGYSQREFAIKTSQDWRLAADVTLAAELAKDNNALAKSSIPPTPEVQVTQTPQGFLRVRLEPSATAAEIGRVKTGDKLEVVQEKGDWVKIKFENKSGWVWRQYVKKI